MSNFQFRAQRERRERFYRRWARINWALFWLAGVSAGYIIGAWHCGEMLGLTR